MAPEVLGLMKDESDPVTEYDFKADMWSLGIIAYILVCGEMLFIDNNKNSLSDTFCGSQHELW